MKNPIILFLLVFSASVFAQEADGYWDNQRATTKEIKLSAGNKILVKSEDFPLGTTEFVYRVTLLDDNQKMVNDLASVLKAIPDPYFIGKGAGGALSLASGISGSDTCTYAIFQDTLTVSDFKTSGNFKKACVFQNNPVSKDANVVSLAKNPCLDDEAQFVWFAFKSENWMMSEKIVLEIVPWVDKIASRGWTSSNRAKVLAFLKTTDVASRLASKDIYGVSLLAKIQKDTRYQEFRDMTPTEKLVLIAKYEDAALADTHNKSAYNKSIRLEANALGKQGKSEEAIQLLDDKIISKGNGEALDYNALGEQYMLSNQFDKALKTLKIAEEKDRSELLVQLNLAHLYMFMDDMSKSKEIHKRYMNQNVSSKQTWKNKAINDLETFKKINLPQDNIGKIWRLFN